MYNLHWVIGSMVDMSPEFTRAVCKLRVMIMVRFTFDGVEMDNGADCRFFFLLVKRDARWGFCFFTLLLFDMDRFVPVHPVEEAERFPAGYRHLAWAESRTGVVPKLNLDSHGLERDVLYRKCRDWLERAIRPDLTGKDFADWEVE
ncbi:hypothetical protein BDV23DRAFT_186039 [Aspergillus alliaceus]|uniref:Uncharacterized protein n=1 Tax=Petromyces alliaceus TaxID=209559 RepID=A0A5N7C113_PETAA|nr:hypothetical protein BDV23DRAFT_186039 [Aspergillus alliaceus]